MSEMAINREAHEGNRASWNAVTPAHNRHKGDQALFLRGGGSTLFPEEKGLLGDLTSKKVVHLQCNCGQDTLSLVQLGAAEVLGVDISDAAVAFATELAEKSELEHKVSFTRSDLFDWFDAAEPASFDVVFASYGVIGWLSNLPRWGRGIAKVLKPGGFFAMVEFHSLAFTLDDNMTLCEPYMSGGGPLPNEDGISDYVQNSMLAGLAPDAQRDPEPFKNPHATTEFAWGIGDTATALLDAGLTVTSLKEYPYSNGCMVFSKCIDIGDRRYGLPPEVPNLPMMFSISATKK